MPRKRLSKLISKQAEAKPLLPLVHNTDAFSFVNALEDGALVPKDCDVFKGEPLLYFFYGRPSYRVNSKEPPTSLDHYLPVCILFKNEKVTPVKRIFPFDSGGFKSDFYKDAFHRDMTLADFGLEPDPATPGRVISLFFGSAEAYLDARPLSSVTVDRAELEAISYHALISQRLSNSADNRVSGIEIQFEGPIKFDGNVEAVVLPAPLLDSPTVKDALQKSKIAALPYRQIDKQRPSEYVTQLFDICREYYISISTVKA